MTSSNADMLRMLIAKKYGLRTHHESKTIWISLGQYGCISCSIDTQWNKLNFRIKNKLEQICLIE